MSESFRFRNACAARTLIDWLFSRASLRSQTAVLQFHTKQPVECWDGRTEMDKRKKSAQHSSSEESKATAMQANGLGGERADVRFSFASD